ncbi:MAG: SAM hydroxide adenosyltransferase, partial [Candidatus Brocadiales bacterium]
EISADGILSGEVIYVDRFGNLITNIDDNIIRGKESCVSSIAIGNREINRLSASYQDGQLGEPVALIGSSGHLEVAINGGNASESLNCSRGEKVVITFGEN